MTPSAPKSDFVNVNGIRLHYLDWGGEGPVLLFLAGMGCSAYIFSRFAPRFTDKFHVLALDRRGHGDSDYPETGYDADTLTEDLRQFLNALKIDKLILASHSMAYIELCHFTALYPERVLKLVFLDGAYDSSVPEQQAVWDNNPAQKMMPPWPVEQLESVEAYAATVKRILPSLNAIWGPVMDEDVRHSVKTTPEGKVVDKMSEAETAALRQTLKTYSPEFASIKVPVLSFFCIHDGHDFLSEEYMTQEQQAQVLEYFETTRQPYTRQWIAQFRRILPHARLVEISNGHHYCFIKQEEIVFQAMRSFLLET
jgi:pimeloyl-ACP methyl ester carboxylesterase